MANEIIDSSWCGEYLNNGEYVKWTGKSKSAGSFRYIFLIASVPITLLAIYFASSGFLDTVKKVIAGEESIITLFIASPVLVIWFALFLSFIVAIIVVPEILKRKTLYAVTDKKVIQKLGKSVKIINLDPLPQIQLFVKRRYGSVKVGTSDYYDNSGFMYLLPWANRNCIILYILMIRQRFIN